MTALVDEVAEVICNTGFAPSTANIVEPEPPFDALMDAVAAGNAEAIQDLRELRMKARAVINHLGTASRAKE